MEETPDYVPGQWPTLCTPPYRIHIYERCGRRRSAHVQQGAGHRYACPLAIHDRTRRRRRTVGARRTPTVAHAVYA